MQIGSDDARTFARDPGHFGDGFDEARRRNRGRTSRPLNQRLHWQREDGTRQPGSELPRKACAKLAEASRGERSVPKTCAPRSRASRIQRPVPQATSRKRQPSKGGRLSSRTLVSKSQQGIQTRIITGRPEAIAFSRITGARTQRLSSRGFRKETKRWAHSSSSGNL